MHIKMRRQSNFQTQLWLMFPHVRFAFLSLSYPFSSTCLSPHERGLESSRSSTSFIRARFITAETEAIGRISCLSPHASSLQRTFPSLIADLHQVVGQLFDGVGRSAGLHGLRVVRNEDGLLGLDDDDAFSALYSHKGNQQSELLPPSICTSIRRSTGTTLETPPPNKSTNPSRIPPPL